MLNNVQTAVTVVQKAYNVCLSQAGLEHIAAAYLQACILDDQAELAAVQKPEVCTRNVSAELAAVCRCGSPCCL
jgi:hypothetical protein